MKRKTTKPVRPSVKLTELPCPQADASGQIKVLWDAIRDALDNCIGADGTMTAALQFEEDGSPTEETRNNIEHTGWNLSTAYGLIEMIKWLTFGPERTLEEIQATIAKATGKGRRS